MNEKNKIKDIVLDYCEVSAEYSLLTVDAFDLDEMVEKIKEAVLHEFEDAEEFVGGLDDARNNVKNHL